MALPVGAFAQQAGPVPNAPGQWQQGCMQTQGQPHRMHGGMRGENPMRQLGLTPQQMSQIQQLHQAYRQAHPCGSQPDRAARHQLRAQIMNVLTPQQRQEYQQLRAQRRAQREQNGGYPQPVATP